jgi:hypothetical protein
VAVPLPHAARLATWLAAWSFGYAGYRAYYALGGDVGMIGVPASESDFRAVNAAGAAIIAAAGVLALLAVRVRGLPRALPALGWLGAVGCCMHALVDMTLCTLSLTGVHAMERPADFWLTVDHRTADLQDLLLNEPWFLVEGLLWGALGLVHVVQVRRPVWLTTAATAVVLLTVVGILSGLDVIGSFVV